MSQKYILMGSDGPDAFYDTDIHTTIPSGGAGFWFVAGYTAHGT